MEFGHDKLDVYRILRGNAVRENQEPHTVGIDPDPDTNPDTEGNQEQTAH